MTLSRDPGYPKLSDHIKPSGTRRAGFTLIEVLVVVAIIALLIAILLPSLAKARDRSRQVACASNLHQIGMAVAMYSQDHKGYMPTLYRTPTPITTYFMHIPNVGRVNLGLLATRRYISEPHTFYCPGQDETKSASLTFNGPDNQWEMPWDSQRIRSSYPARLVGFKRIIFGIERIEVMKSGEPYDWKLQDYNLKVIYSDFTAVRDWQGGGIGEGFITLPHKGDGINRLFGDTAVLWMNNTRPPFNQIEPGETPTEEEVMKYWLELDKGR